MTLQDQLRSTMLAGRDTLQRPALPGFTLSIAPYFESALRLLDRPTP